MVYTDPNGDVLFAWAFVRGLVDAIKHGDISRMDPTLRGTAPNNSIRIWGGLFKTDENKDFGERCLEFISRFTWQAPQTALGYGTAQFTSIFRDVKSVDYYGGATVIESRRSDWGAITLGNFITGQRGIEADPSHWLFQHEYGHYIQSQRIGLGYLIDVGLSSLRSAKKGENNSSYEHHDFWTEQDANNRAYRYFSTHIDGYTDWKFWKNPIYAAPKHKPYKVTQWSLARYDFLFTPVNLLSILRDE